MLKKYTAEAATGGVLEETMFLEISQNAQENTCARVSILIKLQGSALFSCKFCEISKNTFGYRAPPEAVVFLITSKA